MPAETLPHRTAPMLPRWTSVWLYLGFGLSGVGLVLPGALLPAMLGRWHLQDSGAGTLILCVAIGSALGGLLIRGTYRVLLVVSCIAMASSAVTWATSSRMPILPALLWGAGLGILMTSITMLRQRTAPKPATELVRLNFVWALGACICPILMMHALRIGNPRSVLLVAAAVFASYGLGSCCIGGLDLTAKLTRAEELHRSSRFRFGLHGVPLLLVIATSLAPGVEAAMGAWLATYAYRAHQGLVVVVAAPTSLWVGLMCSRSLGMLPAADVVLRHSRRWLLVAVALGATMLWLPFAPYRLLAGVFILGFGLGPLYPLLLDRVLTYRATGSIFFLAGVASSLLPWMTGAVSTWKGSLRDGISVVVIASMMLLVSGWPEPDPQGLMTTPGER